MRDAESARRATVEADIRREAEDQARADIAKLVDQLAELDPARRYAKVATYANTTGDKSAYWDARRELAATVLVREFGMLYGTSAKNRDDHALVDELVAMGYGESSAKGWSSALGTLTSDKKWNIPTEHIASLHADKCKCEHTGNSFVRQGVVNTVLVIPGTVGCLTVHGAYKALQAKGKGTPKPAEDDDSEETAETANSGGVTGDAATIVARALADIQRATDRIKAGDDSVDALQVTVLEQAVARLGRFQLALT